MTRVRHHEDGPSIRLNLQNGGDYAYGTNYEALNLKMFTNGAAAGVIDQQNAAFVDLPTGSGNDAESEQEIEIIFYNFARTSTYRIGSCRALTFDNDNAHGGFWITWSADGLTSGVLTGCHIYANAGFMKNHGHYRIYGRLAV